MKIKITWIKYLLIGTGLVMIFIFSQCKKKTGDYNVKGKYIYINETDSVISVEGSEGFTLDPRASKTILQERDGPENPRAEDYYPPSYSGIIKYNNKCDTLKLYGTIGKGEGILGIVNYTSNKIADRNYEFTYRFTTAYFQDFKPCR